MPIPKPKEDEKETDFIARCMEDDLMKEEFPENEQRLGVCYNQWKERESKAVERKNISLKLKGEEGSFIAKIATLNVVDKDGELTIPGAFPAGKEVLVSAYQHSSWSGDLPVGKAIIQEEGDEVTAEGSFNLKMDAGREHYEAIKFSGGLQEWSYGFTVDEQEEETHDGQKIRILKKLTPYEISPVLLGAGVGTGTLAIKSTYIDEAERTLAVVESLVTRTKSLTDLRAKEGRVLSTANRERMKKLLTSLSEVAADLEGLLEATEPVDTEKLAQAVLLVTKIKRNLEAI